MLGRFDRFPKNVHEVAVFNYQDPKTKLQQTVLCTLQKLNIKTFALNNIMPFFEQDYKVSFEFGIADGQDFTFLDEEQLGQTLKFSEENELVFLDFFVVVRYHKIDENGKQIPLRFDYHVLRFAFHEKIVELLIRHERGTQRIATQDLVEFLTQQVNLELKKEKLTPLIAD
ncbi:MAG TPA: hypothetical protein ENO13_00430 [Candidatus Bathyarchaeota archaeon]|nr:hypothetical protein [Candidatus Bathyarchaeota archaeon]